MNKTELDKIIEVIQKEVDAEAIRFDELPYEKHQQRSISSGKIIGLTRAIGIIRKYKQEINYGN